MYKRTPTAETSATFRPNHESTGTDAAGVIRPQLHAHGACTKVVVDPRRKRHPRGQSSRIGRGHRDGGDSAMDPDHGEGGAPEGGAARDVDGGYGVV